MFSNIKYPKWLGPFTINIVYSYFLWSNSC